MNEKKKNPILKNYCVLYSLDLDNFSEDDLWDNRPNNCALNLFDEERTTDLKEMFFQASNTGVIQATSISEAEIKMMEWINRYFIENVPNILEGLEYDEWQGFCKFLSIINDWEYETVIEYYGKYFEISHREILKDIMDDFYNITSEMEGKEDNLNDLNSLPSDFPLVRKFNLFNDAEKHFFNIWIHRWRFQLFYIENVIKLK